MRQCTHGSGGTLVRLAFCRMLLQAMKRKKNKNQIAFTVAIGKGRNSMAKISVLIIDDDPHIRLSIERAVQLDPLLTMAGSASNGVDGLRIAQDKKPDIILLDMVMPEKDGFTVLKDFQQLNMGNHVTKIVIISSLADTYEIQKTRNMGAFHFVAKPFDLQSLMEIIKDIYYYKEAPLPDPSIFSKPAVVEEYVADLLDELRISSSVKGYKFIQLILTDMVKAPNRICSLSKDLYAHVTEVYGDSPASIERNLRTAIKRAWKLNRFNRSKLFAAYTEKPPTNSQFLSIACTHLSLSVYA